jgi:hypothetical protein
MKNKHFSNHPRPKETFPKQLVLCAGWKSSKRVDPTDFPHPTCASASLFSMYIHIAFACKPEYNRLRIRLCFLLFREQWTQKRLERPAAAAFLPYGGGVCLCRRAAPRQVGVHGASLAVCFATLSMQHPHLASIMDLTSPKGPPTSSEFLTFFQNFIFFAVQILHKPYFGVIFFITDFRVNYMRSLISFQIQLLFQFRFAVPFGSYTLCV